MKTMKQKKKRKGQNRMKLFKRLLAGFLAAAITAFSCVPAVYAQNDDNAAAEQQDENRAPELVVTNGLEYIMKAGTTVMLSVNLHPHPRTKGSFSYIKAVMTSGSSELKVNTKERTATDLKKSFDFSITAQKAALPGEYPLTLTVNLYNNDDMISTQSFEFKMTVRSDLVISGLNIESYSQSKDIVRPGDHFDLSFVLKNDCGIDINNAELSLEGLEPTKFILDKGFPKQYVTIKKDHREKVTYSLIAQSGIKLERENMSLSLSYSLDKNRGDTSRQTSTYVLIKCEPSKASEEEETKFGTRDITMTSYSAGTTVVKNGTKFTLSVDLTNSTTQTIKDARVTVEADGSKFALDTGLGYKDFSIKAGETKKFTFSLIGCAGIASVRETVPIKIEYGNVTSTANATIVCQTDKITPDDAGKYDITVTDYSTDVSVVAENTVFTLTLGVVNRSARNIQKARLSLTGLDGNKFAVDSGLTYCDFDLEAGKSKEISFRLIGCKGIASTREVLPIEISYGEIVSAAYATVKCAPKEEKEKQEEEKQVFAPTIIISSYEFGGEFVNAGETFPLKLVLKNTSGEAVIENLKVTINGASNSTDGSIAYSPANSSNSFFFDTVAKKETAEINMDLLAKSDAAPNSYPINIDFSFEYSVNDKRYQATPFTQTITIPLRQEDRLTINDPELPGWGVGVGEMCTLNTSLVNKGKSAVYNVTATVEGEGFSVETPSYYIGNINSGTEEYYDAKLTPFMEGDISGELVFTYEDSNGTSKEKRIPFTFSAIQMNYGDMDMGMDGMDGMGMDGMDGMGEQTDNTWIWFVVGGGSALLIAGIIIIVVVVKKKKKKAELEDDDEDI